jgi:hypothetical protein
MRKNSTVEINFIHPCKTKYVKGAKFLHNIAQNKDKIMK